MIGEKGKIRKLTMPQTGSINKSHLFTFYQAKLVKWPSLIIRGLRIVEKQIEYLVNITISLISLTLVIFF